MNAEEIFRSFPQTTETLVELRSQNRDAYRGTMNALASRRKLRPVFLEKKTGPERHAWMVAELAKHSNADLAIEVLFGWLMKCRAPMIKTFLDTLGIEHDGAGIIASLPPEPARMKLSAAVEVLLASNPAWVVAIYLNLFCEMDIAKWPHLHELVATDFRLQPPKKDDVESKETASEASISTETESATVRIHAHTDTPDSETSQ